MVIRKANINDINLLVKVRLDHLVASKGSLTEAQEQALYLQLQQYFSKNIAAGQCIGMIADADGIVASAAVLILLEKPANTNFITGKTGILMNVFTYPEYRRKGLATKIITSLIDEARQAGVSVIDLAATKEGKFLYETLGFFVPDYTAMRLKL